MLFQLQQKCNIIVSKVAGEEVERIRKSEEKQSEIDPLAIIKSSDEDEPRSKRLKAPSEPKVSLLDEHSEFKRRLEGSLLSYDNEI